jgi:hypothetical protein
LIEAISGYVNGAKKEGIPAVNYYRSSGMAIHLRHFIGRDLSFRAFYLPLNYTLK